MHESRIETFLAIAETRNLTDASSKLYLSQSTVSTRLKQLEDYLGYKLFFRNKGLTKIELTERGEAFLPLANEFIKLTNKMKENEFISSKIKVSIAATNSIMQSIIFKYINYVQNQSHNILFESKTMHSAEIYDNVYENKIDVGLSLKQFKYAGIETLEIVNIPFYIYRLSGETNSNLDIKNYIYIPRGFEVDNFILKNFNRNDVYNKYADSVITAFLTLKENEWLIAPKSFVDCIPTGLSLDYIRDDKFPNYKIYLVYKLSNYNNNDFFKLVIDSIVKFFENND
ncbi:LysR family transcriptional regulator [Anaerococcus provencensis]|uniref:LysR family transcriptional regulator n=1 Tax=Anaerococcus provencensis TaxID=938293 RepID=UPI0002D53195|nr:LysR family transcriptional regulator [Anaerococcus provencensis]